MNYLIIINPVFFSIIPSFLDFVLPPVELGSAIDWRLTQNRLVSVICKFFRSTAHQKRKKFILFRNHFGREFSELRPISVFLVLVAASNQRPPQHLRVCMLICCNINYICLICFWVFFWFFLRIYPSILSFETINKLKLSFECGIHRPQDVGHLCFWLFWLEGRPGLGVWLITWVNTDSPASSPLFLLSIHHIIS
jgi:hypothetical protein